MSSKSKNYEDLKEFIPQNNYDENYALLSHYLQMPQGDNKQIKKSELIKEFQFEESKISSAEKYFATKNVPLKCQEKNKFTFIDLFAGIGGFRIAMQNCGGRCVFSSEFDDAAKQTYYENYGEVPFGDITKQETKNFIPDNFDVLCAGFPCQPFSVAGYQKGFDDVRGTLFFDIAEILETYKPKLFFLENVKNLKSHDNGKTFKKIIDVLKNRLGYIVDSKVMNPCEYANIPQNRERIFIVGIDPNQINVDDVFFNNESFQFPFPIKIELNKTIHDIIDPSISDTKLFYNEDHIYYPKMKDVITNKDTVYQWRRVYIRENKSGLCPTLTANMGEGGHNVPIIITEKGIRKFSPEECLGFQGFPIKTGFHYPDTIAQSKKYKQAGNSVTEPLIEKVANKLINFLENK